MESRDGWDTSELERAAILATEVRARAGANARIFAVRAPGRVNLIGEHTDYSGLPVLPVAIDRSTIVVAAANSSRDIELSNADRNWPSRRFPIERQIPPYAVGDWANYVKAAMQGVIEQFAGTRQFRGMIMVVDGRVPAAAGLSSSASLTVSTAMAFMAVNGVELEPLQTAAMVARSEWYVGTRAGGMDQAASILGRRDHALFIEFEPLRVRAVKMPSNAALVVGDSSEVADKSGKVRDEYNRRVVECALAARILGRVLKIEQVRILGDVLRGLNEWHADDLIGKLSANAPARLDTNLVEAASTLGISHRALVSELLGEGPLRIELDEKRPLEVLKRARHVLSETERVNRAVIALESGRLDEMGHLMNESHRSLKDDFECSTPRLDAMVECARRAGAFGARLTGAGFGGSIVALCEQARAQEVIESLDREYYAKFSHGKQVENLRAVLHASDGARVLELAAV